MILFIPIKSHQYKALNKCRTFVDKSDWRGHRLLMPPRGQANLQPHDRRHTPEMLWNRGNKSSSPTMRGRTPAAQGAHFPLPFLSLRLAVDAGVGAVGDF